MTYDLDLKPPATYSHAKSKVICLSVQKIELETDRRADGRIDGRTEPITLPSVLTA